ncbi:MAG TPA: hypothetical protein VFZ33_00630 [Chitinophagaceae bacterium]
MKTINLLRALSLLLILAIAVSCRNSRSTTGRQYPRNPSTETPTQTSPVYVDGGNLPPGQAKKVYGGQSAKAYAPGQRKKYANRYPLVIVYSPAIVIKKHSDGRYYYINSAGYTYWKGHDGRYYIDEKHLKGLNYEVSDYDDWKSKGQKNNKAQEAKGKEQEVEKVKEDKKTKDAEQMANVKEQKGNGQNQKPKDDEQKEKDQADQKAKEDKSQKGKVKSKR